MGRFPSGGRCAAALLATLAAILFVVACGESSPADNAAELVTTGTPSAGAAEATATAEPQEREPASAETARASTPAPARAQTPQPIESSTATSEPHAVTSTATPVLIPSANAGAPTPSPAAPSPELAPEPSPTVATGTTSPDEVTAFIWPREMFVSTESEFQVSVMVEPGPLGISAADVIVNFPDGVFDVVDVQPGELLGADPLVGVRRIDGAMGFVQIALARIGPADVPSPRGAVAQITLRPAVAAAAGSYPLGLEVTLVDDQFSEVSFGSIAGGSVRVEAVGADADRPQWSSISQSVESGIADIAFMVKSISGSIEGTSVKKGSLQLGQPSSATDELAAAVAELAGAADAATAKSAITDLYRSLGSVRRTFSSHLGSLSSPKLDTQLEAIGTAILNLQGILDGVPTFGGTPAPAPVYPNDPELVSLNRMWALENTGQTIAHTGGDTFQGTDDSDIDAPEAWAFNTDALETVVAVVDTGVDYTHPDLYLNIWINEGEIPSAARVRIIDVDGDGLVTFYDLNDAANLAVETLADLDGNGRIDGRDLLYRRNCPKVIGSSEETSSDCNPYPGWSNGLDDDDNGYVDDLIGWDFVDDDNDPMDEHFHGTHVAGIIGAIGDNGLGVVGVSWAVRMMPLRILGANGVADFDFFGEGRSQAIRAIKYAADNGARVSNHSWGWNYKDDLPRWAAKLGVDPSDLESLEELADKIGLTDGINEVRKAIRYARDRGHIVVAAAGNGGNDRIGDDTDHVDLRNYPANFDVGNVITVANTDHDDKLSSDSNFGDMSVDLSAPGRWVISTTPVVATDAMADRKVLASYDMLSGTSMAAPHVTGVVALVAAQNPDLTYRQIIDIVLATVDPLPSVGGKTVSGGRLNAAAALAPGPFVIDADVLRTPDGSAYGIRLEFSEGIAANSFTLQDLALIGPMGEPVQIESVQPVGRTGSQFWRVDFPTVVDISGAIYELSLGPHIRDTGGTLMDQDRDGATGERTDDGYTVRFTVRTRLPEPVILSTPELETS